ncbi:MAG TPA: RNA-binding protein [Woeseiaceae bacterium]
MKIYVGNLSYKTTGDDLRIAFARFGEVGAARVVIDRDTGRSRGFGFVDMPHVGEANAAIAAVNGSKLHDRPLRVSEAQAAERPGGRRR